MHIACIIKILSKKDENIKFEEYTFWALLDKFKRKILFKVVWQNSILRSCSKIRSHLECELPRTQLDKINEGDLFFFLRLSFKFQSNFGSLIES